MQTRQSGKFLHLKWRVFIFAICLSFLITGTPLFAADPIVPETWDEITKPYTLADGDTLDLRGLPAEAGTKTIVIPESAKVKVIGNPSVSYKDLKFQLARSADFTIQNLKIDNRTATYDVTYAIEVQGPDTTLILEGSNDMQCRDTAAVLVPAETGIEITSSARGLLTATGNNAAAIGARLYGSTGSITISGNAEVTVYTSKTQAGAGIGGGYDSSGGDVTITDNAIVTAFAFGKRGAAIGGGGAKSSGPGGDGGTLTISGNAKVTAIATDGGTAIGGGIGGSTGQTGGAGANITITDNATLFVSADTGTAIGGGPAGGPAGNGGDGGAVVIMGGAVYVHAGGAGYGIGPGLGGSEGEDGGDAIVTITGGSVNIEKEKVKAAPVNDANTELFLTIKQYPNLAGRSLGFTVDPADGEPYTYNFLVPSDDLAYLWLPEGFTPPPLGGSVSLSAGEVVSVARNTPGVHLTATPGDNTTLVCWQRIDEDENVLDYDDIVPGGMTLTGIPFGTNLYRVKAVWEAFGLPREDVYSNTVAVEVPDVTTGDIHVTADDLPTTMRAGDSQKITYTFASNKATHSVTRVGSEDARGMENSGFNITISGDTQAILTAESAAEGSYSAEFDVIAGGMWLGPIGISLDVKRAADSDDVELVATGAPITSLSTGISVDAHYTAQKKADDLPELDAGISAVRASNNWEESGFDYKTTVPDTLTVTGTAKTPGVYGLSVDLKLGDYEIATESISYTVYANPEDITVTPDGDTEDIERGDIVDIEYSFALDGFPDAVIEIIGVKTSDGWEQSGLLATPDDNDETLGVIGEANAPGEYEITVQITINDVPAAITIPVVIAAKPEDVIVIPKEGRILIDKFTEGDEANATYGFDSDIPDADITLIDAEGAGGWDLSGLEIALGPEDSIRVTGIAKTPGNYAIDVQLTMNNVPVEDVQVHLSIVAKEVPEEDDEDDEEEEDKKKGGGNGNSGCNAASAGGAGLLAFALLPFVYRRKRSK